MFNNEEQMVDMVMKEANDYLTTREKNSGESAKVISMDVENDSVDALFLIGKSTYVICNATKYSKEAHSVTVSSKYIKLMYDGRF